MCGSAPKVPKVVERDPIAEQAKADALAQQKANSEIASRKRRRQRSSLLTSGATGSAAPANSLLAQAQPSSEEHTSELQSLMRSSYAVFCLKKKKINSTQ